MGKVSEQQGVGRRIYMSVSVAVVVFGDDA